MNLQKASRKKAKIKLCLQGPSGSGKTYSALLLAYGLCNDWNKIADGYRKPFCRTICSFRGF
jgi:ATP-dependent protease Clp ATPase subunit